MNKTLNNDNSKPPRRIDTAGCRSSLTDGSTINKEEAKRNRKERQDGLSRRVLSTLCPCWTALATVRPEHATELGQWRSPTQNPRIVLRPVLRKPSGRHQGTSTLRPETCLFPGHASAANPPKGCSDFRE